MANDCKESEEAIELYRRASNFYLENSSPDKAAEVLVKAAKILEDKEPEKAIEFCNDACTIFETEEREQFASSTFKYAIGIAIKQAK